MMMPICCRDELLKGYRAFHKFAVENNVIYQTEGGSTLGAVKLGDVMPWDMDGDGAYYNANMNLFSKNKVWYDENQSPIYVNDIDVKAKGYFCVSVSSTYVESWAKDNLSVDANGIHPRFRERPTLVRIGDAWVYAPTQSRIVFEKLLWMGDVETFKFL
uniref:Uncharacterized protein n=1 Tax=Strigamia maritima TaxID=126957 RepID=T1IHM5_STRMM